MPVFRKNGEIPAWSELRDFDVVELGANDTCALSRAGTREIVVSTYGTGQVVTSAGSMAIAEGQFFIVPSGVDNYELRSHGRPASFMRLSGDWGLDIGGCGVFRVNPGDGPKNVGDPVSYPKLTGIDHHYHDYDEYWIVLDGSGVVRIDDEEFVVRRGDCIATGKGHHHDIPIIHAPFRAVYIETTLAGEKRIGHLWNHKHGQAVPDPDRT
jgi:mannose-6-phosphate isomerase-like protein (cupin superfamily)